MIRLLAFLVLLAGGAALLGWLDYQRFLQYQLPFGVNGEMSVYNVKRGTSVRALAEDLQQRGMFDASEPAPATAAGAAAGAATSTAARPWFGTAHWKHWFYAYARISDKASSIKSGEFDLPGPLTTPEFLDLLVAGRSRQYSHTIIEGTTFREVMQSLKASDILQQTLGDQGGNAVMTSLGVPGDHPEGRFFADTYNFPKDTSDLQFLRRAMRELDRVLEQEWQQREPGLPLKSPYEALILASIVEKETAVAEERPMIAGVFVSRLRKRMRLQTDPTVIYGMGEKYDGNIRRRDLTTDTPYNTYTRAGLPPTPIAMVGRESIHAVMHPAKTSALYFVSRGDGTHKFSDTLEEHNAAVRKYQLRRK